MTETERHRYALKRTGQVFAAAALVYVALLAGCEYAGHSVKAQMGRHIGETVAGTEYSVGVDIQYKAVP